MGKLSEKPNSSKRTEETTETNGNMHDRKTSYPTTHATIREAITTFSMSKLQTTVEGLRLFLIQRESLLKRLELMDTSRRGFIADLLKGTFGWISLLCLRQQIYNMKVKRLSEKMHHMVINNITLIFGIFHVSVCNSSFMRELRLRLLLKVTQRACGRRRISTGLLITQCFTLLL